MEYNSRVFRAFFQEDRDIDNLDELTQLAGDVGLDEVDFRVSLESVEFTKPHNQALEKALALTIQSVPIVFVDGQSFQGGYDSERLRSMLQDLSI